MSAWVHQIMGDEGELSWIGILNSRIRNKVKIQHKNISKLPHIYLHFIDRGNFINYILTLVCVSDCMPGGECSELSQNEIASSNSRCHCQCHNHNISLFYAPLMTDSHQPISALSKNWPFLFLIRSIISPHSSSWPSHKKCYNFLRHQIDGRTILWVQIGVIIHFSPNWIKETGLGGWLLNHFKIFSFPN